MRNHEEQIASQRPFFFSTVTWDVTATAKGPDDSLERATGIKIPNTSHKVVVIDGYIQPQTALPEHIAIVWLTSQMDQLLAEGPKYTLSVFFRSSGLYFTLSHAVAIHRYHTPYDARTYQSAKPSFRR